MALAAVTERPRKSCPNALPTLPSGPALNFYTQYYCEFESRVNRKLLITCALYVRLRSERFRT